MRFRARAVAATAVFLLAGFACHDRSAPAREFDGASALGYVRTQVDFGPRIPGTDGHAREARWLDSLLRARADTVIVQRWTHVTARGDSLALVNFIARFRPAATRRVLYLAHWDTRPRSDQAKDSADRVKPVPGANDGASGVAVLLGVADALHRAPPGIGVDLLFDDGEDYGDFDADTGDVLIGSRYYAAHQVPGAPPMFAVLFDMVGDRDLKIAREGNSLIAAPEVVDLVWQTARDMGYASYFTPYAGLTLTDDHVQLQKVGIRAIDVVDFDYGPANSWWHTPQDTFDKVSAASLKVVGDVAIGVIRGLGR